jgi:hypothetical protein
MLEKDNWVALLKNELCIPASGNKNQTGKAIGKQWSVL